MNPARTAKKYFEDALAEVEHDDTARHQLFAGLADLAEAIEDISVDVADLKQHQPEPSQQPEPSPHSDSSNPR
jgi:hypothetical protein